MTVVAQLAFDFDVMSAAEPEALTDLACARAYWDSWQLAAIVLNKPGSDVYRRTISDAVASCRGRYGSDMLCSQTKRRGVEFGIGHAVHEAPRLVTWRRLWNAARDYAWTLPEELLHALVAAVVADRSAQQRAFEATNPIHRRTMHPTEEERALIEHHHERTFATFVAEREAVEAFWAGAT